MTKLKKSISTIALVLLLVLSSLLLLACNKGTTSADSLALINESLATYTTGTTFKSGEIYGRTTAFYLNNFQSKNSSGILVDEGEAHIAIVANGLEFIKEYSPNLNGLDVNYNFAKLNSKIKDMNEAFDVLSEEHFNLTQVESSANYNIYNGYFARYKEYSKQFAEEVYNVAEELGNLLFVKEKIINAGATSDVVTYDLGYEELLINRDFKNFFIKSAEGKEFNQSLYNIAQSRYKLYCTFFSTTASKQINKNTLADFEMVSKAINADRENATTSLSKFSLYDYYVAYEGSLSAYEKANEDASIYYTNINSYFGTEGILSKYYTYLLAL